MDEGRLLTGDVLGEPIVPTNATTSPPVTIQSIDSIKTSEKGEKILDIICFFTKEYSLVDPTDKKEKQYWDCKYCIAKKQEKMWFVRDTTTARWHLESMHRDAYIEWCNRNDFSSMLPRDRKAECTAVSSTTTQTTLAGVFPVTSNPTPTKIPYTAGNFMCAALKWVIATDQALSAVEEPSYRKMIQIAAAPPNGKVDIPSWHIT
ncbi:hypothetical protein E1B28_003683 [Marasmius oreades]|uniref:Uncharacterized protein n=1 Tax=Marasmius oreades TaxID=181124 RepID=A0A9P7UX28_9AGAR|nr:uncharacterized protein E1B28_003683 [Marasmius oreades]KAG7096234.1 hypothetical protein E1B28_003683 [Marasmius oreades]